MSSLDEKLSTPPRSSGDRARASMAQLLNRVGRSIATGGDDGDTITIKSMDVVETWKRLSGRGREAVFELEPTKGSQ